MASAAVSTHVGAGPLSLMSCVRESSPQESIGDVENEKHVSKRRFWNPRKWFKRKSNKVAEDGGSGAEVPEPGNTETIRSRSTSELSETEEPVRRRSGTPMHPGLSVSHDSIFHSPNSESDLELETAESTSSLSIHQPTQSELRLQTELSERLRLRRGRGDTSEDDEGLPRSVCNSPTATEGLLEKSTIKDHPQKSHSTCSDGSLLSMGSSEIDEDSLGQQSSRHSSKVSLHERKPIEQDGDLELGPGSVTAPLNHSAAHHRVSVRPKKTHGAPRRKKQQISGTALPTTPEVNEEFSMHNLTQDTRETITQLYTATSTCMSKTRSNAVTETQLKCSSLPPGLAGPGVDNNKLNRSRSSAGSKSQDPFTAVGEEDEEKEDKKPDTSIFGRLFPRRSGKKKKSKDTVDVVSSRSYVKQTMESNNYTSVTTTNSSASQISTSTSTVMVNKPLERRPYDSNFAIRPNALIKSGPASRQRVQPIDIPATPDSDRREFDIPISPLKSSPGTTPLQLELENHLRQRTTVVLSTSPPKYSLPVIDTPPQSPKSPKVQLSRSASPPKTSWSEKPNYNKVSSTRLFENNRETKIEESRSKPKFAGLSTLQQRVLLHSDDNDDDDGFKSLTVLPTDEHSTRKPVTKSHSFKTSTFIKDSCGSNDSNYQYSVMSKSATQEKKVFTSETKHEVICNVSKLNPSSVVKAASLDSIKNIEVIIKPENIENNKDKSESSESLNSESSAQTSSTEYLDSLNPPSSITISGPSHTAIVSVCNSQHLETVDKTSNFITSLDKEPVISCIKFKDSTEDEQTFKEQQTFSDQIYKEHKKDNIFNEQFTVKEQQISVTKIQVKRETVQVSQNTAVTDRTTLPEFFNVHLNKIDAKPNTNVVLATSVNSPKLLESDKQSKPKTVFNFDVNKDFTTTEISVDNSKRKFSKDDIEIIDKTKLEESDAVIRTSPVSTPSTPNVVITSMTPPVANNRIFKRHSEAVTQYNQLRKSSLVSIAPEQKNKPALKTKSSSLEIVDSIIKSPEIVDTVDKSSQNSLDKLEETKPKSNSITELPENIEGVVLRRKSIVRQAKDDEPELMKVFARRSLKLKDNDDILNQQVILTVEDSKNMDNSEANLGKSRDSDKENTLDSPSEERKKPKEIDKIKEPLVETAEVTLRKPLNNKFSAYPRTISVNVPKSNDINIDKPQKLNSYNDRPKTEITERVTNKTWMITSVKHQEPELKEEVLRKISQEEVITSLSQKSDFINEDFPTLPKNFNQRKAEWEKRAQEALKKNVP